MFRNSIPVICYHRIDDNDPITPKIFETHLRYIKKAAIRTLGLKEMHDFLYGKSRINGRSLMLTFDDGYQDFYHNAYPLLKKYDIKAVVFLIADRLVSDPDRKAVSPTLSYDEIHKHAFKGDFQGFLSLEQVLEMKQSGLVEFGAHTKSHSVINVSSKITGIYKGQKPKWYYRDAIRLKKGNPLFQLAPSLVGPEFIPNPEYVEKFTQMANQFKDDIKEIESELSAIPKGTFETNEDWLNRIDDEIVTAKKILESNIGAPITGFCWPWGIESREAKTVLKNSGYQLLFTLKRGSNSTLEHAFSVKRFSARKKGNSWLFSRLLVFNSSLLSSWYNSKKQHQISTLPHF